MKLKITALLIAGSIFTGFAQRNDVQEQNLHGKVKTIRETRFEPIIKGEKIQKGKQAICEDFIVSQPYFAFDEQGYITHHTEYGPKNEVVSKETYTVVNPGKTRKAYKYNPKGELISTTEYEYNDLNQLVTNTEFDASGSKVSELAYTYNDEKQMIKQVSIHFPTDHHSLYTARYENGLLTEETMEGSVYMHIKNKFDAKGNVIESLYYSASDSLEYTIYKKYDDKANMTEYRFDNGDDVPLTESYQYEYDKQGNWTKRIIFEEQKPQCIIERKITYY